MWLKWWAPTFLQIEKSCETVSVIQFNQRRPPFRFKVMSQIRTLVLYEFKFKRKHHRHKQRFESYITHYLVNSTWTLSIYWKVEKKKVLPSLFWRISRETVIGFSFVYIYYKHAWFNGWLEFNVVSTVFQTSCMPKTLNYGSNFKGRDLGRNTRKSLGHVSDN